MVPRLLLAFIFFCTPALADSTDRSAEYILNRVFNGTDSLNTSSGSGTADLSDFGAVGDGTTDDTSAIQDAFDYCETNNLTCTGSGTFKITSQVTLKSSADLHNATFNVYSTPAIAIQVSTATPESSQFFSRVLLGKDIKLPQLSNQTKPATGWDGQGIGVKIINAQNCRIFHNITSGFSIGVWYTTDETIVGGTGNVYNNVFLQRIINNKTNLLLKPSSNNGWVNQNTFYGGNLDFSSSEGSNVTDVRNLALLNYDPTNVDQVDQNVFVNLSAESAVPDYTLELSGTNTTFYSPRFEGGTKIRLTCSDTLVGCWNNIMVGGEPWFRHGITVSKTGSRGRNLVFIGADGGDYDQANGLFDVVSVSRDTMNVVNLMSYDSGVGGRILFKGKYNDGGNPIISFGSIGGVKENTSEANKRGSLVFSSGSSTGAITEKMRLTSDGNLIVSGDILTYGSDATQTTERGRMFYDSTLNRMVLSPDTGFLQIGSPSNVVSLDGGTTTMGQLNLFGLNGGCIMFKDRDNAGYTEVSFLDGTIQATTDANGVCDGS